MVVDILRSLLFGQTKQGGGVESWRALFVSTLTELDYSNAPSEKSIIMVVVERGGVRSRRRES